MVTYKIVLDKRRAKQNQTFPLLVRVTYNRVVCAFQTGVYLTWKQWDPQTLQVKRGVENSLALTTKISNFYLLIQKSILEVERNGDFTFDAIKALLYPKSIEKPRELTFKSYSHAVIQDMMKAKRTGGALVYQTAVNRLLEYTKNQELLFSQIDFSLLDAFKNKLIEDGLKPNSIGNYFRSIRALFNKAIKSKVVSRDLYPFHEIPIKTEETAKRSIGAPTLKLLHDLPKDLQTQVWHASNYFFLSFVLRGMSFTDMAYLKRSNIQDGYLRYRRRKTHKLYTIKLHPTALDILALYENCSCDYLIPIFPAGVSEDSIVAKKITRQWIKTTNKYLNLIAVDCRVENNITTYVVRHTWATIAKALKYPNEMIAEALGHEYGNKVTNIYLDSFDQALIDDMNSEVIAQVIQDALIIQKTRKPILSGMGFCSNSIGDYRINLKGLSCPI